MRSFNGWYFDLFESGNGACLNQQEIAEEAWDYQQSKVDELEHKAKLRESDHKALLVKYQATKKCWEDISKEKEELQTQLSLQRQRVKAFEEELTNSRNYGDELQKRVDAALKETQFALQYVEEDMRGNHEFLKMAMIRTFKVLEKALKGEG